MRVTFADVRDALVKLTEDHPCWPLQDATRVAALAALDHLEKIGLPPPQLWPMDAAAPKPGKRGPYKKRAAVA